MLAVELLQQWLTSTSRTCLGSNPQASLFAATATNIGLQYPLVMHALLSLSALHLSWTEPSRWTALQRTARELRALGLASFQQLDLTSQPDQVIPSLLFSFITGVHQLCHALAYGRSDFSTFLHALTECISVLRGVSIVVAGRMDIVRHSELGPLLIPPPRTHALSVIQQAAVQAIDALRTLCDWTMLPVETAKILVEAIDGLRALYEELSDDALDPGIGVVVVWMMKAPSGFTELLDDRVPQALVVLAHTAPLLHARRSCWAVGDAGVFTVESVSRCVGVEWQCWLEWPRRAVGLAV